MQYMQYKKQASVNVGIERIPEIKQKVTILYAMKKEKKIGYKYNYKRSWKNENEN
ncbi:unnamed protein product [marine sediment metagenome]|uniref:Uncharacterized protein n=1 Tax=marine sediment metagenome TaxID=412755 RepID=X1RHJ3_9ZZZZ